MFTKTLSENAQKSLALLGQGVLPPNTYLAGGSALALHFGHRISIDFDFFTNVSFSSEKLANDLIKIGCFKTQTVLKDTLLGNFNDIRFSVFYYRYPLLFQAIDYQGVLIADPKDIAAMKIAAVMDRGTKKDFIDLYFLSKKGVPLESCLEYYEKKYEALATNLYSIITSLSYFVDAENSEMPQMIDKVNWEKVKSFFEKEAVRLGKKYLKK
jgi:hypothetical protein